MRLKRYNNDDLNKKLENKFSELLKENFIIQDKSLAWNKRGVLAVENNRISFYGHFYLNQDIKNEENRLNENYQYAIEILNSYKKIK